MHILQGIFSSWDKERLCSNKATKIFVAPGDHSFSLFQEENIPWSMCVLLTSPLINIGLLMTSRFHSVHEIIAKRISGLYFPM